MKKLGKSLWEGEDPDYPQIVFDSVKDNPAFIHLIQDTDPRNTQQPWFLEWFQSYICSLWELPIFEDMLRKLVGFMCEELQHERFEDKRPMIMASILAVRVVFLDCLTFLMALVILDIKWYSSLR